MQINMSAKRVISALVKNETVCHSLNAYIIFFWHLNFEIEIHNQCVIIQEKELIKVPFGN